MHGGTRAREGGRLAALMLERVAAMRAEVAAVEPLIPGLVVAYRERLAARLREAAVDADPARIKRDLDRLLRASASWDLPGR